MISDSKTNILVKLIVLSLVKAFKRSLKKETEASFWDWFALMDRTVDLVCLTLTCEGSQGRFLFHAIFALFLLY